MTAAQKKDDKIVLNAEKREVFGKKLGPLREEGKLPANVFGKDFKSTAISIDGRTFLKTFRQAGETQVIYLALDKKEIPVLVSTYHLHPLTTEITHVDFKKMDLSQKTEANVPVVIVGEAPAVTQKLGDLINPVDELTVEALPDRIPSEIEIDVSGLTEVDAAIKVSDLATDKDYTFQDDPETVIVKIAEHKEEEIEVSEATEEDAGDAAASESSTEGTEEKPADGGVEKKEE